MVVSRRILQAFAVRRRLELQLGGGAPTLPPDASRGPGTFGKRNGRVVRDRAARPRPRPVSLAARSGESGLRHVLGLQQRKAGGGETRAAIAISGVSTKPGATR